jgi:hypothetical protein
MVWDYLKNKFKLFIISVLIKLTIHILMTQSLPLLYDIINAGGWAVHVNIISLQITSIISYSRPRDYKVWSSAATWKPLLFLASQKRSNAVKKEGLIHCLPMKCRSRIMCNRGIQSLFIHLHIQSLRTVNRFNFNS